MTTVGPGEGGADALGRLLDERRLVVVCGAGGVGKTTVSAALGAAVARRSDRRVLVLTVDPARRLASALGLGEGLGDAPARVAPGLWMAMLDTKQSWDALVRRHAPDPATRDAILANPLYRNITAKFVAAHDYIAAERLHELGESGEWDLIVVDTPPSRHALDFLEAPARMAEFFGSRLLRWLTVPYRSKMFTMASRPFFAVADRILGAQFLADIAAFFVLFQTMEAGFVRRAAAVERTLRDRSTTFVLVTTLESAPAQEAAVFAGRLAAKRFRLGAVVANRVLPAALSHPEAVDAADDLGHGLAGYAAAVARTVGAEQADVERVLGEALGGFGNLLVAAERQGRLMAQLAGLAPVLARGPLLDDDVNDLDRLRRLGALLGAG